MCSIITNQTNESVQTLQIEKLTPHKFSNTEHNAVYEGDTEHVESQNSLFIIGLNKIFSCFLFLSKKIGAMVILRDFSVSDIF